VHGLRWPTASANSRARNNGRHAAAFKARFGWLAQGSAVNARFD
jgi:hypothetical protein